MKELDKIGFGTYGIQNKEIIKLALQVGYRTIDTAVLYKNHSLIAEAINELKINREEIFIISKIHNKDQKNGTIIESYNEIIKHFGGYVDLLLLHAPVKNKFIESWKVLEDLYLNKKVRYIGVSNFRINELIDLLAKCRVKPYINQIEISPYNTRKELGLFCTNKGIRLQAYSSLIKGSDKMNNQILVTIAEKYKISLAQLLLKWSLQKGNCIIPMSKNENHMRENLQVCKIKDLDDNDIEKMDRMDEKYYTIKHYKD